jgi:glycine oxidase
MIVVLGGGLIGLGIAYELAKRGAEVRVLEAGEPGRAASWAAAGMLAPYTEGLAGTPFEAFCAHSLALYPAYVDELREAGGVDARLKLDGIVRAAYSESEAVELRRHAAAAALAGVESSWLERRDLLNAEPALDGRALGGLLFSAEGQVDNRRLGRALAAACTARGVRVDANGGLVALEADARRVRGVRSRDGFVAASAVINATGAWAGQVEGVPREARLPVVPVKGQMLALGLPRGLMRRVVWVPGAYLVPRDDGRLLVGATVEQAAFDVRVTADGMRALLDAALSAAPALRDLAVVETWAGLRPGSADGLPYIGATALEGYFVAGGHYRNGVLLAPATAREVADAVEGKPPSAAGRGLSPLRLPGGSRPDSLAC